MKQICALMTLFAGAAILHASPPTRLRHAIQNSGTFVLAGHGRLLLERAQDLGEVDSSLLLPQLEVHFAMSPAQVADLNTLLVSQRDRSSKSYHKWLTPEKF